jgi:hypothetical protein
LGCLLKVKSLPAIGSKAFLLICALEGSRTPNLLIRSQVLYPIKLRMHIPPRQRTAKVMLEIEYSNVFLKIMRNAHLKGGF